ncbi:4-deoxy-4-formamido-L-arabinose-phosphoundecaprenol deformylase [Rosenbergiella australiborealis]|uniref:Probable 4-deoxy-4-formamido-L-arabinose-phosphoundecaprenol deformylase ArnD n=1 Tax=Rosenbergiella australiborealis TaxID=1544696 RepID=A0ABS5T0J8_9GAMM|nr:4-deoxy-4-formamido-L-arabinose-phosphoundecaprenol deformylase [Rosenbergiella australiborealis]MBT0725873.1 4-deoxy-4-formamido-L-arabinose-phosphoundecaprenol deformylase [Rosenbergiella australiborealis]
MKNNVKRVGLRIDVDTLRGTRYGVPALLKDLSQYHCKASFFFSVGPDNMGRHLWRLIRPAFLAKMIRSRAASLYGWDILLAGTCWPGKKIGQECEAIIRAAANKHEVGLHAWDHYAWQTHIDTWSEEQLHEQFTLGLNELSRIIDRPVECSAAPGWRADQQVIESQQRFGLRYQSDCRGVGLFRPQYLSSDISTIQIPVTLPTWDEVVGRTLSASAFNRYLLDTIHRAGGNPVYTIHAEVEGLVASTYFKQLLQLATEEGIEFCPLGELIPDDITQLPLGTIVRQSLPGREGWVGHQQLREQCS